MGTSIWPIHPQPQQDELLSSWMIRLAQGNGFKIHSFYAEFFGRGRQIWTRDIDHHAPGWLTDGLAARTGVSPERIANTTLRAFESYAFERFNEAGTTRWIMPLGVYHRTRRAYGQQFCPQCLAEDERPYLRRQWRLAFVAVCTRHAALLQDRCAACLRPLAPHRADTDPRRSRRGRLTLLQCTYCWNALGAPPQPVTGEEVAIQFGLIHVLEEGYATVGSSPVYAHLYFNGLRLLMAGVARSPAHAGLVNFERASAAERLSRLRTAMDLLERWPKALLARCQSIPQPYTAFTRDARGVPYWLDTVLRRHVLQTPAQLSIQEAKAITAAAERVVGLASTSGARRLSGRDVSKVLPVPGVEDDLADVLIASLDHEIGQAKGLQRTLLLRDKVMFIAARNLHLSTPALVALRIADIDIDDSDADEEFSFWDRVDSAARTAGMLRWYLHRIRPCLSADSNASELFVTQAGRMSDSAVGMRFQRALRASWLTRSISNWARWIACDKKQARPVRRVTGKGNR